MPIHQSRYNRTLGWDSAGGPSPRRPAHVKRTRDYRKWWLITLAVSTVVIVILGVLCIVFFLRSRSTDTSATTVTTETKPDTSNWKTYEDKDAGLMFRYPAEWKFNTKESKSEQDILNVEVGLTTEEVNASLQVEAIQNTNNVALAEWVKEFGVRDASTESTTVNNKSALVARFHNTTTGEKQDVYYVSQGRTLFVFDIYQSAEQANIAAILQSILSSITIAGETAGESDASATSDSSSSMNIKDVLLVVNSVGTSRDDTITLYSPAGKKDDEVFSDKDINLFMKGEGDVGVSTKTLYAYFGQSGLTSRDGIYAVTLDGKTETPKKILADITPDIIRVSDDGKVIAYLNGKRGDSSEIILLDTAGKQTHSVTLPDDVVAFDLSHDGSKIAVVTTGSGVITIYSNSGDKEKSFQATDDNILDLHGNDVLSTFALIIDQGREATNAAELYFYDGKKLTRLTNDAFVQTNPRLTLDGKSIYYTAYKADAKNNKSIWKIGIDGKNDTNIIKSDNMSLLGFTQ